MHKDLERKGKLVADSLRGETFPLYETITISVLARNTN